MTAPRELAAGVRVRRLLAVASLATALTGTGLVGDALPAQAAPVPGPAASAGPCPPPSKVPVELRAQEGKEGWTLHFQLPPFAGYTDVRVGFDDRPPGSLGHEHALDVMTGRPQARTWLVLPPEWATPGAHRLAVRLVRRDGSVDGPHLLRFDAGAERLALAKRTVEQLADEVLSWSEHGETVTWLGFDTLFRLRHSVREVLYSIDDCTLDERIVFAADAEAEPTATGRRQENDLILGRPVLSLPKATTRSACVRVVFGDGTVSPVFVVRRQLGEKR